MEHKSVTVHTGSEIGGAVRACCRSASRAKAPTTALGAAGRRSGGLGGVVLTAVLGEDVGAVLAGVLGDPGLAPGDPAHGESRSRHHPLLGLLRAHG